MRILHSYLLKQCAVPFLLTMIIFTFVLLVGNLFKEVDLIVNKGVEPIKILQLLGYVALNMLGYTVPLAALTTVLFVFSRLAADNEVTTIRSSGIPFYQVAVPVIVIALVLSCATLLVNDRFVPQAHYGIRRLVKEIAIRRPTAYLEPGTFIKEFEGYIIFIHSIQHNELHNIRIYEPQEAGPARTIIAQRGIFITNPDTQVVKLRLLDGTSDERSPHDPNLFYNLKFRSYEMTFDLSEYFGAKTVKKRSKDMTLKELREELRDLKSNGINPDPIITESHKRFASSFSVLALSVLGLPLSVRSKHRERSVNFVLCLALMSAYWFLFAWGTATAFKGTWDPVWPVWIPNGLFVVIGAFCLVRAERC